MKIQLKGWQIVNLNLSVLDEKDRRHENSFDIDIGNYFSQEKDSNRFSIAFNLNVKDKLFDILLQSVFDFELIDEKITEEFKLSSFPKVNAPAIAFPYLRAFISNLTLQSGLEVVILPSINFVEFANSGSLE